MLDIKSHKSRKFIVNRIKLCTDALIYLKLYTLYVLNKDPNIFKHSAKINT